MPYHVLICSRTGFSVTTLASEGDALAVMHHHQQKSATLYLALYGPDGLIETWQPTGENA